MTPFTIDPDITRASTLPAAAYADPECFALQRERLFPRTWHFSHAGETETLTPWTMLPGCLDEPLLWSAGRCLSNVCTHRGATLVEAPCRDTAIRCPYHGRRFRLDGAFDFMPEFDGARDFPSGKDDLPVVPSAEWRGFRFASLAPATTFETLLGPAAARFAHLPIERLRFDPATSRDYELRANWALYVDNYLEGFHVPYVHPTLAGTLDYGEYSTEIFDHAVLQIGIAKPGELAFEGTRVGGYYLWLFPTTAFNFYPWGLSMNVVKPEGPDRTRVTYLSYMWDASKRDRGAGAGLHGVEMEDDAIVERVQRGVRSRLYERGRYSPSRERGVHHFHRLLARSLFE